MANRAAFVNEKGASITIRDAPYPTCKPGYVVVKNSAVALNPIDWKLQSFGFLIQSWPTILGSDVAGEVVQVGENVDRIRIGDRVIGHAFALATGDLAEAAFQLYTLVPADMVAHIPQNMSFESAVVLPLAVSCAAAALFEKNALALPLPERNSKTNEGFVLIWGGSSSVGASAIQLARACGLEVITTASPKNFDYVKGLGASLVFDHADPEIIMKLVDPLKDSHFVGAFDTVGSNIQECADVVAALGGGHVVATGDPPKDLPFTVTANHVFATSIKDNEIGKVIYGNYLPAALADGSLKPAPQPTIVGKGLESIQDGLNRLKQGVSATKLVVSLS